MVFFSETERWTAVAWQKSQKNRVLVGCGCEGKMLLLGVESLSVGGGGCPVVISHPAITTVHMARKAQFRVALPCTCLILPLLINRVKMKRESRAASMESIRPQRARTLAMA